jgi:hypothetical protein
VISPTLLAGVGRRLEQDSNAQKRMTSADHYRSCVLTLVLVFLGSVFVEACSQSSFPTKIGREFVVEVADRGNPVVGLQIELSTDPGSGPGQSHPVSLVRTDGNGWARFIGIPPRLYYVGIRHPAFAYSIEIKVMRVPPKGSDQRIAFEWPGVKPLSVQSVSGVLNGHARTSRGLGPDSLHPIHLPVPGARLTLSVAISNEAIDSQITDQAGMFSFQALPVGLYFLRVESTNTASVRWFYPNDGYIPIEIDSAARLASLNVLLDQAICGELGFENREGKIQ